MCRFGAATRTVLPPSRALGKYRRKTGRPAVSHEETAAASRGCLSLRLPIHGSKSAGGREQMRTKLEQYVKASELAALPGGASRAAEIRETFSFLSGQHGEPTGGS